MLTFLLPLDEEVIGAIRKVDLRYKHKYFVGVRQRKKKINY